MPSGSFRNELKERKEKKEFYFLACFVESVKKKIMASEDKQATNRLKLLYFLLFLYF